MIPEMFGLTKSVIIMELIDRYDPFRRRRFRRGLWIDVLSSGPADCAEIPSFPSLLRQTPGLLMSFYTVRFSFVTYASLSAKRRKSRGRGTLLMMNSVIEAT